MRAGQIVEQGTHQQLLALQGYYFKLIAAQEFEEFEEEDDDDDDDDEKRTLQQDHEFLVDVDDIQKAEHPVRSSTESDPDGGLGRSPTDQAQSVVMAPEEADSDGLTSSNPSLWTLVKMTARYNAQEWPWMLLGLCCSITCGAASPASAVFFAKVLVALTSYDIGSPASQTIHEVTFWSLMYVALAASQLVAAVVEGYAFAFCSERLMRRVRRMAFSAILTQDASFFDARTAGTLTALLAADPTNLAALSGPTLGTLLNALTTIIAVLALSIVVGWKLALATATTIPVVLLCGYLRFGVLVSMQTRTKEAYMSSASHACEAVSAIRVVASLAREEDVLRRYELDLKQYEAQNFPSIAYCSALYAISQSLTYVCMALGFWYGGKLIADGEYGPLQFYVCFAAITFGSQTAGIVLSFVRKSTSPDKLPFQFRSLTRCIADMGKAYQAARQLRALFDTTPEIEGHTATGQVIDTMEGSIRFQDCHFSYPTRQHVPVLRGLTFNVQPRQFVAIVGASGSGKSTVISLLERFYDPDSGKIFVDGSIPLSSASSVGVRSPRSMRVPY
jgi:ATP-binding cassette subfamily B (MDR/TAP) protein 1